MRGCAQTSFPTCTRHSSASTKGTSRLEVETPRRPSDQARTPSRRTHRSPGAASSTPRSAPWVAGTSWSASIRPGLRRTYPPLTHPADGDRRVCGPRAADALLRVWASHHEMCIPQHLEVESHRGQVRGSGLAALAKSAGGVSGGGLPAGFVHGTAAVPPDVGAVAAAGACAGHRLGVPPLARETRRGKSKPSAANRLGNDTGPDTRPVPSPEARDTNHALQPTAALVKQWATCEHGG